MTWSSPRAFVALCLALVVTASVSDAEAQRRGRRARAEPQGTLAIQGTEGAEVTVNGEVVGVTPLDPISLPSGTHTVRVRRDGFTEINEVVRVRVGEETPLFADLFALAMALRLNSDPEGARVFVDGAFRGETPIELELPEGMRSIRLALPTHHEAVREVLAVPGESESLSVVLDPLPADQLPGARPLDWYEEPLTWGLIAGGVVVLAIVIGIIVHATQEPDPFCQSFEMENRCFEVNGGAAIFPLVSF